MFPKLYLHVERTKPFSRNEKNPFATYQRFHNPFAKYGITVTLAIRKLDALGRFLARNPATY